MCKQWVTITPSPPPLPPSPPLHTAGRHVSGALQGLAAGACGAQGEAGAGAVHLVHAVHQGRVTPSPHNLPPYLSVGCAPTLTPRPPCRWSWSCRQHWTSWRCTAGLRHQECLTSSSGEAAGVRNGGWEKSGRTQGPWLRIRMRVCGDHVEGCPSLHLPCYLSAHAVPSPLHPNHQSPSSRTGVRMPTRTRRSCGWSWASCVTCGAWTRMS